MSRFGSGWWLKGRFSPSITQAGAGGWTPALWFLASEEGVWYDGGDMSAMFQDSAGTTPVTAVEQPVGKILDKSGRGNHATQATTAQKPVLSARKNLLTYSEDFTNAAWVKTTGIAVTVVGGAFRITDSDAGATSAYMRSASGIVPAGQSTITLEFDRKVGGMFVLGLGNFWCYVDHATLSTQFATDFAGTSPSATVTQLDGSRYAVSVTVTMAGASDFRVYPAVSSFKPDINSAPNPATTGYLDIYTAQVEPGSTATTYQRVTTSSDYDTVGFYHYGKLDRVDDNMTAATGGGGTTGIIVCAAIRAGGAGNARTIWSDRGTNTGYRLSVNASNQLVLSAGNGAAHTEVVGPTITAGTDYVVTGWHDGANLNVQANAGAATSAAFGTATAGTAGFTIGKDNGAATGYYSERIYEIVYRKDDASTAGDRTSLITYMAAQAGITL